VVSLHQLILTNCHQFYFPPCPHIFSATSYCLPPLLWSVLQGPLSFLALLLSWYQSHFHRAIAASILFLCIIISSAKVGKITWKCLLGRWLPAVHKMNWAAWVYSQKGKGICINHRSPLMFVPNMISVLCKWRIVLAPITGVLLDWILVQATWWGSTFWN
jgi:hypothetical protein